MWKYIIRIFLFIFPLILSARIPQAEDSITVKKNSRHLLDGVRISYDLGKRLWASYKNGRIDQVSFFLSRGKHIAGFYYGNEQMPYVSPRYVFSVTGNYFKLEYAYNFFDNWPGMRNEIDLGIRYGQARFDYFLTSYELTPAFPGYTAVHVQTAREYNRLKASWIEASVNVRAEIFKGFFLDLSVSGKYFLNGSKPDNFSLIYIPGFYTTNISRFGFGLGYGISYYLDL
jgi:hypothetical protein